MEGKSVMMHGLMTLLVLLLVIVNTSTAATIDIKLTVPLHKGFTYICGGGSSASIYPPGTPCWSTGEIAFDDTVVNLATDTISLVLVLSWPVPIAMGG